MATIRERVDSKGNKTYHVQVRIQGFPPQTQTFDSKTMAKQWASEIESRIRNNTCINFAEAKQRTVRDLLERYRDEILIPHRPRSAKDQTQQLEWWIKKIGAFSLANITPALIAKYRDELANTPVGNHNIKRPRAAATVVRYLAVLSRAFNVAVMEWGWISESPVAKVSKPKVKNDRVRYLSEQELDSLLNAANQSANPYLSTIVLIAVATGMRYSEIMNLRWRDITLNRDENTALIILEKTKNDERRGVPLVGAACQAVLSLRKKVPQSGIVSELLFPSMDRPEKPVEIRKAWETALKRAQIENFRFHDLRHTTASYLAMDGATAPEIAEILGHKDLQMVKRYAHLGKEHITKVMQRLSQSRLGDAGLDTEVDHHSGGTD